MRNTERVKAVFPNQDSVTDVRREIVEYIYKNVYMPCKFPNTSPNIAGIFARRLSPHGCALSVLPTAPMFSGLSTSSEVGGSLG